MRTPISLLFLIALTSLLAGCGQSVDELEARADFKADYELWREGEKKLLDSGIKLNYYQPGTTEVEAVGVDRDTMVAYEIQAPYTLAGTRVDALEKYIKDSESFLAKHDKFLKNRPLWRAIRKAIDATRWLQDDTKKLFSPYPPKNPAPEPETAIRRGALEALENKLAVHFGLAFITEFERVANERARYTSVKHDAKAWKEKEATLTMAQIDERNMNVKDLLSSCEEYLKLIETDNDDRLLTNILKLRIEALKDLVRSL